MKLFSVVPADIKITAIKTTEPKFSGESWLQTTKTISGVSVNFHFKNTEGDSGNTYFNVQGTWYRIPNKEWTKFGINGLGGVSDFNTELSKTLQSEPSDEEKEGIVSSVLPSAPPPSPTDIVANVKSFEKFQDFIVIENISQEIKNLTVGQVLRIAKPGDEEGSVIVFLKDGEFILQKDNYRAASDSEVMEYFTINSSGCATADIEISKNDKDLSDEAGVVISVQQPHIIIKFPQLPTPTTFFLKDVRKSTQDEILHSLISGVAVRGFKRGVHVIESKKGLTGTIVDFVLSFNILHALVRDAGGSQRITPVYALALDGPQINFPLMTFTGVALTEIVSTVINRTLQDYPCSEVNFKEWSIFLNNLDQLSKELWDEYKKASIVKP
jgi:hypothetical protein